MMTSLLLFLALLGGQATPGQPASRQPAPPQASRPVAPAGQDACAEAAQKALAIVEAATTRTEGARGEGTAERAIADVQNAIAAAQAELFTCRAAVRPTTSAAPGPGAMPGMDHSKMAMGTPTQTSTPAKPGAKPVDSMAGMDHSKMNMGKPSSKPAKTGVGLGAKPVDSMAGMDHSKMNMSKPRSKPAKAGIEPAAKPADPMAGMDHPKAATTERSAVGEPAPLSPGGGKLPVAMAERIADPACPENVGQATAPKAVYERKVYYFCSAKDRDEFRKDPPAYLKKRPR